MYGHQITIRKKKLARLKFATYEDYMMSDLWQKRKKAYEARVPKICVYCGSSASVELHHKMYDRLGAETDNDLAWFCYEHHVVATQSEAMPKPVTPMQSTLLAQLRCPHDISEWTSWDASKWIDKKLHPATKHWWEKKTKFQAPVENYTTDLLQKIVNSTDKEWEEQDIR